MQLLILFYFSTLIGACGSVIKTEKRDCTSKNWHEIGRQNGFKAAAKNPFYNELVKCEHNQLFKEQFDIGYDTGLANYCTEENAYHLGKAGDTYRKVCSNAIEPFFKSFYQKGKKVYELEIKNIELQTEIYRVKRKWLNTKEEKSKEVLFSELNSLKEEKVNNKNQINQFEAFL